MRQVLAARRTPLAALLDELDIGIGAAGIDEGAEALELFRVFQGVGPLAFVAIDHLLRQDAFIAVVRRASPAHRIIAEF
ncbi:hypothetical protein PMM47T1_13308 [Pseudomonas sp. M47T1]|uniref:hypothetical protein n=1 Tax=Pseudomonas sp. M47T1 TaxID=1179778 RepID=UPI0002607D9A|nr:hypothetical protein [Pseudomonas sp. M47T1]EIK96272.1 hypothetical protein PMM47T1_13308 [Pseudomonas sp. M47T1]